MPRTRTILRWLATAATALLLALYYLSVPFYTGSSIGAHVNWRFEHARLKIQWSPAAYSETFYVDLNHEGLRWAPDCHFYAKDQWFVTIPLWVALALTAPVMGYLWYRRFTHCGPGRCKRCGYDRRGLAAGSPCPECGSGKPARAG